MILQIVKIGEKMNRAIFFDVDGTLLDSMHGQSEISEAVVSKLRKLQEQGDYIFIATGRPHSFMSDYLLNFGFDGLLLNNGAHIEMHNKTIYKKPLEREFVKKITAALEEKRIEYILQGEAHSYLKQEFKVFNHFFDSFGILTSKVIRNFDPAEIDVFKIEVLCKEKEQQDYCTSFLETYPSYTHFFSISGEVCEIHAKESTKGTGILKVLELLNIPVENSYAFGDGDNDIEMLQTVGCGIAMDNATDEVKAYADKITLSVQEDGVAAGIEQYIFNEKYEQKDSLCS